MAQQVNLSNSQVADIYQDMLKGDKNVLSKLQQLSFVSHLPQVHRHPQPFRHQHKAKINTEQNVSHHQESNTSQLLYASRDQGDFRESSSLANMASKKEQGMINAIKNGAKMGGIPKQEHVDRFYKPPRRLANSQNEQYKSVRRESRGEKRIHQQTRHQKQFSTELKTNLTAQLPMAKNTKISILPKVPKPRQIAKTKSAQVAVPKKQASISEPQRSPKQPKKKEKADFKQMIGKNKQQRTQFQKNNDKELIAQMQIVDLYRNNKDHLEYIRDKYGLNYNNKQKYLKKKKKPEDIYHFKNKQKQKQVEQTQHLSPFKASIQKQKHKCQDITEQMNTLRILFNNNIGLLTKVQNATNALPYARFLQHRLEQMSDISEEEQDVVEPLESAQQIKNKYKNIMAVTRQRKFGLNQRTEYEAQRTQSLSNSRQTGSDSRFTTGTQHKFLSTKNDDNKVVINQRLKNLLFS